MKYADSLVDSRDDAEDMVHDVYASLWARRRVWTLRGSMLSYLRRAVRNRALDNRKRARRWQVIGPDIPSPPEPVASDQRVLNFELEVATLEVVATLPVRCRQVFLLCAIAGNNHADAAATLGLKPSTVNYYLVFARKGILAGLRARGFELPAWVTRPEMIFANIADAPDNSRRHRQSNIRIMTTVDLTRHDPATPFTTVDVRVHRRRSIFISE